MMLNTTRLQFLSLFIFLFVFVQKAVASEIPAIKGYVKNANTGAPIVGVWVKWTSSGCTPGNCSCGGISTFPSSSRYVKTDANGFYNFYDWQESLVPNFSYNLPISQWGADWNTRVDIDLDGLETSGPNADPFKQPSIWCPDDPWEHWEPGNFGCYANPHKYTVVLPAGWNGYFDTIANVNFANDSADITLATIFYHPPVIPPTPVPTNTLFPTYTPYPTYTPKPTNTPKPTVTPGGPTVTPEPTETPEPSASPLPTSTYPPTPTNLPTPTPAPNYTISGTVYLDLNSNQIKDVGEPPYTEGMSIVIFDENDMSNTYRTTDANGNYAAGNLFSGAYTVFGYAPSGYLLTSASEVAVSLGPNRVINFGLSSSNILSGKVFIDKNKNNIKDPDEINYTQPVTINAGGKIAQTTNGNYTIPFNAPTSAIVVSLTSTLANGFVMVYPLNGPPPSYSVTLGTNCTVNNPYYGSCDAQGNIIELNFAVTDSIPWIQSKGINVRMDNGFTSYVPSTPACGTGPYASVPDTSSPAGIIYTGDINSNFGNGNPSISGWVVGGTSYPEIYKTAGSSLPTSYNTVLTNVNKSGAEITNLSTVCSNLADCTLPSGLPTGTYQANGNVVLNGHNFKNDENFIFLINGNLTILDDLTVPNQSTVLFTTTGDIIVDQEVGPNNLSCNSVSNLEGMYSADSDIIIEGKNDCTVAPDKRLIVEGAFFVNAELSGGVFTNSRDLCADNYSYPSITFKSRADFVLNAPRLFRINNLTYNEITP